ncbi:hypothetical protein ACH4ND_21165, partial [Streptomyces sp. NPDC017179]|uniref:hypothetical protein n=1 Tax=Streptomyces sp. NPDC017179 TaxID=3364979 RepID=UPI0037ADDD97
GGAGNGDIAPPPRASRTTARQRDDSTRDAAPPAHGPGRRYGGGAGNGDIAPPPRASRTTARQRDDSTRDAAPRRHDVP